MFPNKRFVTVGINLALPLSFQQIIWDLIDQFPNHLTLDYLQVFELEDIDYGKEQAILVHRQEFPKYEKKYQIKLPCQVLQALQNKKIYVIDDKEYCTMLFAHEY